MRIQTPLGWKFNGHEKLNKLTYTSVHHATVTKITEKQKCAVVNLLKNNQSRNRLTPHTVYDIIARKALRGPQM